MLAHTFLIPVIASRVKALACNQFDYDCDVSVDTRAASAAVKAYKPFVASLCTRMKNEGALRQVLIAGKGVENRVEPRWNSVECGIV